MIDFFKAVARDANIDIENSKISFEQRVKVSSGELSRFFEGKYKGLLVRVYNNGFLIVCGSLHKFYNDGEHNHNQFNHVSIIEALNRVSELLNCPLDELKLQNLEFGLNLEVSFAPKAAIDGFLYHNGIVPEIRFKGFYREFRHSEYSIKLYDKSYHYGLENRLFRVELKMVKSRLINKLIGAYNMKDLTDLNKLEKAKNALIDKVSEVIQCYPFTTEAVDNCKWTDSKFWAKLDKRKRYSERQLFEKWKTQGCPQMPPLDELIKLKFSQLT